MVIAEFGTVQRRMEVSTIYVTHDQVEAMTMGDRITVMRDGTLQRVDTSQHLYDNPDTIFVAAFIGSPAMNLYDAVVGEGARSLKLGSEEIDLPESVVLKRRALRSYAGKEVVVGLRPEHLPAEAPTAPARSWPATWTWSRRSARNLWSGEGVARVSAKTPVKPGDKLTFAVDIHDMKFFDTQTGLSIRG